MRNSTVILHDDEIRSKMQAESKPAGEIEAALAARKTAQQTAQAAYDKVPPATAYRKTPE